jgi:hypothetical protein
MSDQTDIQDAAPERDERTAEDLAKLEGAEAVYNDSGELVYVRLPSVTELHPTQVPGYEAQFDRAGTVRRVLVFVTDEVDLDANEQNMSRYLQGKEAFGPRNTVEAIAFAAARDDHTPGVPPNYDAAKDIVASALEKLEEAGLVTRRTAGSYKLTAAGQTELRN